MATGDLTNNLRKLQKELKHVRYSEAVNLSGMSQGSPAAFLPVYHYVFTSYSHAIAQMISSTDAELFGKTDFRFIEGVYKILRDLFNYKPPITKEQFFNNGFAERKIIMCFEVLQKIREKNRSLQPSKRSTSGTSVSGISQLYQGKTSRPKSANHLALRKSASSSAMSALSSKTKKPCDDDHTFARPSTAVDSRCVQMSSPPQVVNELLQPYSPTEMTRHMPSQSSQECSSPPRVIREVVSSPEDQPRPRGFKWAVITPSVSKVRADAVEVVSIPRELRPQEVEPRPQEVEPRPQEVESRPQEEVSDDRTDQEDSTDEETDTSNSAPPQQQTSNVIQQQLETLMARMVLLENRMSMVESKVGDTYRPAQSNGYGSGDNHPHVQPLPMSSVGRMTSQPYPTIQNTVPSSAESNKPPIPRTQQSKTTGDPASFALSPIRKPSDMSFNNSALDVTNEGTFSMPSQDEAARRSSTPAQCSDLENFRSNTSVSFRFDDTSTQDKINRIKHMFKATEGMLNN